MSSARVRLALAGVLLLAVAGVTGLSGASMTGAAQEEPSVFSGGTLELSAAAAPGSTGLDASNMRPGQNRSGIIALRNSGTVPATLSAAIKDRLDTPAEAGLSTVLKLRIEDCSASQACAAPTVAYDGLLSAFSTAKLGTAAGGATRYVRVSLSWDAADSNPVRQGAATSATLVWQAVAGASA